ncbi:MAG TPA: Mur ligase family protein, partial [Spirochaetales bacterium]|nr:Mur ligase family protein [Spirochaetales bacterium]
MPYRNGVPLSKADLAGMRVVVMGLGLNGGGLGSARFFARSGAEVTVTDGKDAEALAPSIRQLEGLPIRYVLGRHELADFQSADLVIKNPGVRPDSPYLAAARRVETDLSVFLSLSRADLVAVTGSKGKSTTSSAIAWALREALPERDVLFGGNITVSVLDLVDRAVEGAICVLELSSFQLGDLKGRGLLKPRVSVLTRIVPDHLDRYGTMEAYLADKRAVYAEQESDAYTV